MKKKLEKLALSKESVRRLDGQSVDEAAGGVTQLCDTTTSLSVGCSPYPSQCACGSGMRCY